MRLTEIVVDVDAFDLDVDTIGVLEKGRKLRTVPFPPSTGRAISRYLRVRAKHRQAYRPEMWLAERGRDPLTANGIAQMIRRHGKLAGVGDDIGRHFHPHLARHTFSHEFLAAGGSESDLMLLMGWSSPTMPRRYGKSAATERAHAAARKMRVGEARLRAINRATHDPGEDVVDPEHKLAAHQRIAMAESVLVCLGVSAAFELVEVAVGGVTDQSGVAFLGTQGDPLAAQWDMALALAGALLSLTVLRRVHDRQLP